MTTEILKHGFGYLYQTEQDLRDEGYYPEGLCLLNKRWGYIIGKGDIPEGVELVRKFEFGWHASFIEDEISPILMEKIEKSPGQNRDVSQLMGEEI